MTKQGGVTQAQKIINGTGEKAQWGKPYGVDGISVFMRTDEPFVFKLSGYGLSAGMFNLRKTGVYRLISSCTYTENYLILIKEEHK